MAKSSLADILEIRDLVWRFADAVNRNDGRAFLALWSVNGCWQSEPPASLDANGSEALAALFASLMGQWRFFHQSVNPGPVTIVHDRAKAASYVQELGVFTAGGTLRNFGRYDDEFVRTADGWRFTRRFYSFFYVDTPQLDPQFTRQPKA